MAYDVYVVAAKADRDMARLVTRRLRALKMKVFYDAKDEDDVFTSKEARKLEQSDSVLVLWSQAAVESDEVRAAASQGYSNKAQPLVQVTLDGTVPYEPFSAETLHSLDGFTTRTNTEGWYTAVETLGGYQGREGLRAWMDFKTSDKDGQDAWLKAHPDDPLAVAARPKASDAARKEAVASKPDKSPETSETSSSAGKAAALTGAAAAGLAARTSETPEAVQSGSSVAAAGAVGGGAAATAVASPSHDEDIGGMGWGMLLPVLLGVLAMLWLAWFWRTGYQPSVMPTASTEPVLARACPPGQMPKSMLNILEPSGSIIVDE